MLTYRNWIAMLIAAMSVWMGVAQAQDRPPVADKVVAYQAQQGVKVWTLRIGDRAANEALVQVEGADHDWNLRIQKMKVEKTSKDTRYVTTINGQKYVALIVQGNWGGELYLPGEPQPLAVGYSESLSNQGDAQAFLTDYLRKQQ